MKLNNLRKTRAFTEENSLCHYKIIVEYGFDPPIGKQDPHFSITSEIYQGKQLDSCGCQHDKIAKHFPELKPLIAFHLWNYNGIPIQYIENSVYLWELWQGVSKWESKKSKEEYYQILCDRIYLLPNKTIPEKREQFVEWLKLRQPRIQEAFHKTMKEFDLIEE